MSDLVKEIANTVVRIKSEMRKASFASRSEAGRYAANQRWKNNAKNSFEPNKEKHVAVAGANPPDDPNRSGWHDRHNDLKKEFNNSFEKVFTKTVLVKAGERLVGQGYGSDRTATKEDIAFGFETSKYLKDTLNPLFDQVDGVLTQLENQVGDKDAHLKTLKSVKTKVSALARKSEKEQKTSGNFPANKEDSTVRSMIYNTRTLMLKNFASHIERTLELESGTDRDNPYTKPISKGRSFASRSEAGRYAANMRWKGQGNTDTAQLIAYRQSGNSKEAKLTEQKIEQRLAAEGKTSPAERMAAGLRDFKGKTPKQKYDFSPQDYKMVRDAMPQLSAADAKKLTQYLLDNNAFGDTSEMSNKEMSNEFALYLDDALGGGSSKSSKKTSKQEAAAVERMDLSMRSVQALEEKTLNRAAERYKTDPPSAADKKLLEDTKKEVLDLGESAKKAIQDAFAGGGRSGTDKLGKTVASASRKVARQMVEEGLERKMSTDPAPEITIRGTILQTKIMILNGIEAQLKEIPNALTASYDVGKARSFSSRSEAGRYAANMRWRGRTGDLTNHTERDYARLDELTPEQETIVEQQAQEMYQSTGLYSSTANYYANNAASFGFRPPAYKAPGGVDRGRDILDNDRNDNGDSIEDLNSRYQNDSEYIAFEDLPKGGFREQVIGAFIDAKAAGYYDEPGRLKGPYDRPSSQMTDKGYAKARAHALRGNPDGRESDLEDYWDDNSSIYWDEYAMTTDSYSTNE